LTAALISAKKLFMANDNLDEHTVDELNRIAHREGAEVPAGALKADIIKAIQKHRKGQQKESGAAHSAAGGPVPAGVEEQIRHGGIASDDPRRSPLPETIDIQERSKELQQEDRERSDNQGNKEEPEAATKSA
jgi:hypothetical protein